MGSRRLGSGQFCRCFHLPQTSGNIESSKRKPRGQLYLNSLGRVHFGELLNLNVFTDYSHVNPRKITRVIHS